MCFGGLWEVVSEGFEQEEGVEGGILCIRVLTMSKGCTVKVAMLPADRPAKVSTRAEDGRRGLRLPVPVLGGVVMVPFRILNLRRQRKEDRVEGKVYI